MFIGSLRDDTTRDRGGQGVKISRRSIERAM